MKHRSLLTLIAICAALVPSCGDGITGVDIDNLDPGFEAYTGGNSNNIFENGYIARINAASSPVHGGSVSVQFQDVEQQEIRFPSHLHPTRVPVEPGNAYRFYVWAHGIDVGGGALTSQVPIEFFPVYYLQGAFVGVAGSTTVNLTSFGTWQRLEFTFTAIQGVDNAYFSVLATAAVGLNVDLYLDDIAIERIN